MTNSNTEITDSSDGFTEVGLESFDSNENNQNSPYSGDLKEQLQSGQAEIVDISVAPEEYDAYNAKDSTPEPEEPASPSDALELARISLELEKVKYAKQQALLDHQQQLIALEKEESKRSNKLSNIFKERLKDRFNLKYNQEQARNTDEKWQKLELEAKKDENLHIKETRKSKRDHLRESLEFKREKRKEDYAHKKEKRAEKSRINLSRRKKLNEAIEQRIQKRADKKDSLDDLLVKKKQERWDIKLSRKQHDEAIYKSMEENKARLSNYERAYAAAHKERRREVSTSEIEHKAADKKAVREGTQETRIESEVKIIDAETTAKVDNIKSKSETKHVKDNVKRTVISHSRNIESKVDSKVQLRQAATNLAKAPMEVTADYIKTTGELFTVPAKVVIAGSKYAMALIDSEIAELEGESKVSDERRRAEIQETRDVSDYKSQIYDTMSYSARYGHPMTFSRANGRLQLDSDYSNKHKMAQQNAKEEYETYGANRKAYYRRPVSQRQTIDRSNRSEDYLENYRKRAAERERARELTRERAEKRAAEKAAEKAAAERAAEKAAEKRAAEKRAAEKAAEKAAAERAAAERAAEKAAEKRAEKRERERAKQATQAAQKQAALKQTKAQPSEQSTATEESTELDDWIERIGNKADKIEEVYKEEEERQQDQKKKQRAIGSSKGREQE